MLNPMTLEFLLVEFAIVLLVTYFLPNFHNLFHLFGILLLFLRFLFIFLFLIILFQSLIEVKGIPV